MDERKTKGMVKQTFSMTDQYISYTRTRKREEATRAILKGSNVEEKTV